MRQVTRPRIEALDVIGLAAPLGHDLALFKEGIADLNRLVEQAARVGAQVDDIAERPPAGRLVDPEQRFAGHRPSLRREPVDINDADIVLHFPLHRLQLDALAGDGDVEWLVAAWT